MARRIKKQDYKDVFERVGIKWRKSWTLEKIKDTWKSWRKDFEKIEGHKAPTFNQAKSEQKFTEYVTDILEQGEGIPVEWEDAIDTRGFVDTPRDSQMRTETAQGMDDAKEYIDNFLVRAESIYLDTMSMIDRAMSEGAKHLEDQLGALGNPYRLVIEQSYIAIREKIATMRSEFGDEVLAQAMAGNVELDYDIAISLIAPSDIEVEFEETLSQLEALEDQINERATQLAEQAEKEYYGE